MHAFSKPPELLACFALLNPLLPPGWHLELADADSDLHEQWASSGGRLNVTRQDLLRGRRPALSLAVVARDHVDAVLVPDPAGSHAELADRVLEVLDQLGVIES